MPTFTAKYALGPNLALTKLYISEENGVFTSVSSHKPAGDVIDFGEAIIVPGTVNTHTHSMQSLIRGFGDDLDLLTWLQKNVYKYCQDMNEDHAYWGALLSFAEMVRSGITTVIDFFYLNGRGNACARAVIRAARDLGIRLVLARTLMDWEKSPETLREQPALAAERFRELFAEFKDDGMIKVCPAPHSAYGASSEMIRAALRLSQELDVPCHMHVCDSKGAMELTAQSKGQNYIAYLKDIGALNHRFVAIHCIWCDEQDIELLAEAGVQVSHNPVSNKFLGEPTANIAKMLERGMIVGLGTDGAASNNRLSIFQEMKAAALDQKSLHRDPEIIKAETILRMGTEYGARIARFPVGRLENGFGADFIVIGLDDPALHPERHLTSHLVYALPDRAVKDVYIAGRPVLRDGRFTRIDALELQTKVEELTSSW